MAQSHVEIAKQLKHNSEEIKEYFEDLYAWQSEVSKEVGGNSGKEQSSTVRNGPAKGSKSFAAKLEKKKKDHDGQGQKLHGRSSEIVDPAAANILHRETELRQNNNALKRDQNSLDSYYNAWDKLKIEDIDNGHDGSGEDREGHNGEASERTEKGGYSDGILHWERKIEELAPTIDTERRNSMNICNGIWGKAERKDGLSESNNCVLNRRNEEERLMKIDCKVYDIYLSKNEEGKINYQKRWYNKCLENYNDIINYIDFELSNNNIFLQIEQNLDNELYIDVLSQNKQIFLNKNIEQLSILRTKVLVNRSLVYQRLSSYFESINDCSSIILFYKYFLPEHKNCASYCIGKNSLTVNIKYVLFKAYYLRGMARYKLKIYKYSLKDFKFAKECANDMNCCSTLNIDKSIQLLQNVITQIDTKRRARRQAEYTSTLLERYKLKPRLLTIQLISREQTEEIIPLENNRNDVKCLTGLPNAEEPSTGCASGGWNSPSEERKYLRHFAQGGNPPKVHDGGNAPVGKNSSLGAVSEGEHNTVGHKDREIERDNHHDTDSSLTLSESTALSDVEETKPPLLTMSRGANLGKNKIKNKISFELLWNSNEIKSNFKKQIDILKTAFLEEHIFQFNLDRDLYVDILDSLFKNNFLSLFENMDNEDIKIKLQRDACAGLPPNVDKEIDRTSKSPSDGELGCVEEREDEEKLLNCAECVVLIDILYILTNGGKENYVLLFVDKKERTLLLTFYNFILKYTNVFLCNENCLREKTLLLKGLLERIS
ncbi:conserved Plasmodium protein, unknown function [Plasmodium knowlesi strain H]|uniref:Uncharacterized protein n=3 Tax=Plasmodium knowlesi TaxID=5850 RepID=A0A5K1VJG3_PLAKH|nr:conserved Plasmodium protein, unknown function [Plasmodium knowlesi strain H]OTN64060.1 Uncharacterized protein PKNOH_S140237800 [Plasmodium knowlesi]CAA9990800.1 conserved Plasmodium protein, unknown function [Plasmodium knowlesi strain H]SBO21049.1 conserved Plasmodium protein, unknown function [Plasmodium knowlesi strain H]SBO21534.1 conserved Plasmodium protein, unknown function [Plasmodium knowlesi strain H]VVS80274.1 conserved Plasmodium protein, unknown function [Plasmodium knowlesi |eukprot:XP_002262088.1 hypothetical protein, conserved in Plasmodium species [Plasmodium knowlesi strain H]